MSNLASDFDPKEGKSGCRSCAFTLLGAVTLLILFFMALGPISPGIKRGEEGLAMQRAHAIGLMLFAYANDHNMQFPGGSSSTEVFQKLIDEQYCSDPSVFYIPRAGKSEPISGQKLKPENVCFDVTVSLDGHSSDALPLAFTTGYKIDYVPDGVATALKNSPQFNEDSGSWLWRSEGSRPWGDAGIAVAYKDSHSRFTRAEIGANGETIIPHFISPDFKPDGKTYRQLTPEGSLP